MTNPDGSQPSDASSGYGSGGLLPALIQAGSAFYGAAVSKRNTDKTIEANKEQSQYAYSKDLEQWNRQNDYNSPQAQMARLRGAGLNPNMVYGTGAAGATGNATGQQPKYNAPTIEYNYKPYVDLPSMLGMYQEFQMRQAQLNNVRAQNESIKLHNVNEAIRTNLMNVQYDTDTKKYKNLVQQTPYQTDILRSQSEQGLARTEQEWQKVRLMSQEEQTRALNQQYLQKQISGATIENERKEAELLFARYRNEWMAQGVTSSDHPLLRIFIRMANESGITIPDMKSMSDFKLPGSYKQ